MGRGLTILGSQSRMQNSAKPNFISPNLPREGGLPSNFENGCAAQKVTRRLQDADNPMVPPRSKHLCQTCSCKARLCTNNLGSEDICFAFVCKSHIFALFLRLRAILGQSNKLNLVAYKYISQQNHPRLLTLDTPTWP